MLLTPDERERATQTTETANQRLQVILMALERRISADPNVFHTLLTALMAEPALEAVGREMKGIYDDEEQGIQQKQQPNTQQGNETEATRRRFHIRVEDTLHLLSLSREAFAHAKIEVHPEKPLTYDWKGHGFKVDVPAGAISSSGPATMYIQASLKGDYQFPDEGVLVSGVYSLSLYPPVDKLDKKVTITLQHCACVDDDDEEAALSFYTAKDTPPYIFERLPGGSFSESGEASIDVNHFTWFTVFGKKPLKYAIFTYYVPKQLNIHEAHITVTLKKELLIEKVKQLYKERRAEEGPVVPMVKLMPGKDQITLDLDTSEETWSKDGWSPVSFSSFCYPKRGTG
ncbi:hypothetical protein GBAR_LOCUS25022 [Geodia barretti]|uniref:Uncharacterized protein n=1 Tax=Geodia barretti TaxID=519541 RepID=A0AA35TDX8_GEOBA|nr:hypothetical protein GBAR_LOCUS25022 [Geodia barretti]